MSRLTDRLDAWYDRQSIESMLLWYFGVVLVLQAVVIGLVILLSEIT